jgi:hypothetical protein
MRRRGLNPHHRLSEADPAAFPLRGPFGSTVAGCGSRGPLAPHLAQALAEGAGFEPAVPGRVQQFSKLSASTAHPPLRWLHGSF